MNEFKRGVGFGLWIGLILGFIVMLLFLHSPAQAQQKEAIIDFPDGWESPLETRIEIYLDPQQKQTPAQQIKQLTQQLQNSNFLLAAEKADTEKLILEKAVQQGTINQLNNKLLQTQNILRKLVKDGKIKIKDLKALTTLGYSFGNNAELPSSLPDSTNSN